MSRDLPPDPEWSFNRMADMLSRIDDRLAEICDVLDSRHWIRPKPKKPEPAPPETEVPSGHHELFRFVGFVLHASGAPTDGSVSVGDIIDKWQAFERARAEKEKART